MKHQMGIISKHDDDDFLASFSIIDHKVSLFPLNELTNDKCRKLQYTDTSSDNDSWMYGYSDSHAIAILRRGTVPTTFSKTIIFHSPMILRSSRCINCEIVEHSFDAIEFVGGIIDILYPTQMAYRGNNKKFIIKERHEYTRIYTVQINGEELILEYSIKVKCHNERQIPDYSDTHSTITLRFNESKNFSEIEKYYSYVLTLCQFCSGCLNVGFDINVYSETDNIFYSTSFSDSFDDHAETFLRTNDVINLTSIDCDIISLFKVIVEEKTKPHLLFLPKRNDEYGAIKYTDVTDMCVAIDREYRLLRIPYLIDMDKINAISKDVIDFLKSKSTDEEFINRVSGLLGQMKNPSLKSMICQLYENFFSCVDKITNNGIEDELRTIKRYSKDEFFVLAGKFVDIRNKAAHKGIVWNEGIDIYHHLRLLIYLSVLDRSGCSNERSIELIDSLFYRFFL